MSEQSHLRQMRGSRKPKVLGSRKMADNVVRLKEILEKVDALLDVSTFIGLAGLGVAVGSVMVTAAATYERTAREISFKDSTGKALPKSERDKNAEDQEKLLDLADASHFASKQFFQAVSPAITGIALLFGLDGFFETSAWSIDTVQEADADFFASLIQNGYQDELMETFFGSILLAWILILYVRGSSSLTALSPVRK